MKTKNQTQYTKKNLFLIWRRSNFFANRNSKKTRFLWMYFRSRDAYFCAEKTILGMGFQQNCHFYVEFRIFRVAIPHREIFFLVECVEFRYLIFFINFQQISVSGIVAQKCFSSLAQKYAKCTFGYFQYYYYHFSAQKMLFGPRG